MKSGLTQELRERLKERSTQDHPLPANYFVSVDWEDRQEVQGMPTCYSTLATGVSMDGNRYPSENVLLDFNELSHQGFVMSSDDVIYGASCRFRVCDSNEAVGRIVETANERRAFPVIYCEVWIHFSSDEEEIESLKYGMKRFAGLLTRIELQKERGSTVAKVWGGHRGIVVSKDAEDTNVAANAWDCPVPLKLPAWGRAGSTAVP
ncbi:MAG: hypothetical protein OXE73_00025 [Gammaproteobacteria bacterium]|nr:hypothetical protein [Gammaproteobacteria bacterium]